MKRTKIKTLNEQYAEFSGKKVKVCGWARTIRDSKNIAFIELNDGAFKSCQIVVESGKVENYNEIVSQLTGASFEIEGTSLRNQR